MKTTFPPLPLGEGSGVRGVGGVTAAASRGSCPHPNPLPTGEGTARTGAHSGALPKGEGTARRGALARSGFSLLEVILALAILAVAMAVLGELSRQGIRSASYARDMAQAQLLCESKMAEITAGISLPEPVAGAVFDAADLVDPNDPVPWLYSIATGAVEEPGVIAVAVTVSQDLPPEKRPATLTLVRWIADPGIELSDPRVTETDGAYGNGASGTSSGGTSGASSGTNAKSASGSSSGSPSGSSSGSGQNPQGGSRG